MRKCVFLLVLGIAAAFAQQALTIDKLVQFITSSIQQKLPDKEVAAGVAGIRLSEKLEDSVIEELQKKGAGPRTVAALTHLADQSAKLPAAAAPPVALAPKVVSTGPPPPSADEQERILRQVQEYALGYVTSLPDFLCLEERGVPSICTRRRGRRIPGRRRTGWPRS